MTSKRLFFVLLAALFLLAAGIVGGAYEINGLLEKQSNKLVDRKAKQQSLQQQQTQLAQMKKDIVTYNSLYQISKLIVPQSKDQTETVRQINNLATENGVTIASITFPSSSLGTGSSSLSLTQTKPVAGPTPSSAGLSANPALSQLVAISHIPGVYDLPITVTSSNDSKHLATYPELIGFLSALEQNRLTAQVSAISITPDSTNRSYLSFTLNLDTFIKPGTSQ